MSEYNRRYQDGEVIKLGVRMDKLETDMIEVKGDVKSLLALANQTKGGWKVIILVASVAGTFGALIAKALPFLGSIPR